MMAETKQTLRKLSARNTSPRRERGSEPPSLALFEAALFAVRPLPACPAGEAVQQLGNARRNSTQPLPACPAGEGVQAAKPYQAAELLHLPDKPAGVGGKEQCLLAPELLHLPGQPAGVPVGRQ